MGYSSQKDRAVPCNGCRACCIGDAIRIMPYDNASLYKTEPHPFQPGELMLAHKPNRECWYLGEGGCTIHADRPAQCRTFDCRELVRHLGYTQGRKLVAKGGLQAMVFRKGRELIARERG